MEKGAYAGGTYRVLKPLGEGGTARVYLVLHRRTSGLFAMKEIPLKGENWSRAEKDYARHLSHPGLPRIYDLFRENGCAYLVMDYISGTTLKDIQAKQGFVRERELQDWILQLLEILCYLHSRVPPLIHGDIKPSNLMLDEKGRIVLLDFGACLVKGRRAQQRYGTRAFASPEQRRGYPEPDFRSDFYSMGKTFQYLAAGTESSAFFRILKRCTEEKPENRYGSHRELKRAVKRLKGRGRRYTLCLALLALFFLLAGSIRKYCLQRFDEDRQYGILLQSSQISQLESAIKSFPGREEGYQALLQFYLRDQEFSGEESRNLERILAEGEEAFRNAGAAYGSFCYDLGIAYWYYYTGPGGKNYALSWFQKVPEEADSEKGRRAEVYRTLGEYYVQKSRKELTGEGEFSWSGFLKALEAMCRMQEESEETESLRKKFQEEALSEVYASLPALHAAEISKETLLETLTRLQNLSPENLPEQFQLTRESVDTLYGDEDEK